MVAAHAHELLSHTMARKACIEQLRPGITVCKQLPPGLDAALEHARHLTTIEASGYSAACQHQGTALHVSIRAYIYLTCGCLPGPALTSCLPSQPSDTSSVVAESSGT